VDRVKGVSEKRCFFLSFVARSFRDDTPDHPPRAILDATFESGAFKAEHGRPKWNMAAFLLAPRFDIVEVAHLEDMMTCRVM
jgi:hypothetical protein